MDHNRFGLDEDVVLNWFYQKNAFDDLTATMAILKLCETKQKKTVKQIE